jgi:hypothetical protein
MTRYRFRMVPSLVIKKTLFKSGTAEDTIPQVIADRALARIIHEFPLVVVFVASVRVGVRVV